MFQIVFRYIIIVGVVEKQRIMFVGENDYTKDLLVGIKKDEQYRFIEHYQNVEKKDYGYDILKICDLKLSDESEKIVIDSENQEAYNEEKLLNNKMLGKFPFFNPGENKISWSGNIEKISITPNSRWL